MDVIVSAILPVFALVLAGFLAGRRRLLGSEATDSLNRFVVWLALPALLFRALAQANLRDLGDWRFIAAFGGGMMGTFALSFAGRSREGVRLADRSIEGLAAAYANTGFLGIPLALALFGQAAVPPAVLAAILTVCVVFAVAIVLIEFDLQAGVTPGIVMGKVARSLLRNPLLVALRRSGPPSPQPGGRCLWRSSDSPPFWAPRRAPARSSPSGCSWRTTGRAATGPR